MYGPRVILRTVVEPREVRDMFARIAPGYDRANHLLSLGIDRAWRRAAVRCVDAVPGAEVLDVCAGTGDLSFALARAGARVTGSDFCFEMVDHAVRKVRGAGGAAPRFLTADALALPFGGDRFDAATVAFGIRNVADPVAGLAEMRRVVRPGGKVVVLEFTTPRLPLVAGAYGFYFHRILPRLGRWITGDRGGAYSYLPASVERFAEREEFLALMRAAGLADTTYRALTLGIAALYRGTVPA